MRLVQAAADAGALRCATLHDSVPITCDNRLQAAIQSGTPVLAEHTESRRPDKNGHANRQLNCSRMIGQRFFDLAQTAKYIAFVGFNRSQQACSFSVARRAERND